MKGKSKILMCNFALSALLSADAFAGPICSNPNNQVANCSYTASKSGTHIFQAISYVRDGFDEPSVWVEIYVNGQPCGERTTTGFIGGNGSVSGQCSGTLSEGKAYKIEVKSSNTRATAAGVSLSVIPPGGEDLDLR